MKKLYESNKFLMGLIVGVVICIFVFIAVYFVKGFINNNKCYEGYSYDETHKICSKRKQVITDEKGNCPYDYGYNEYDNTCVQYDEYKP